MRRDSKSSLLLIFLVVFIDLVGFGIVIPILPYYAKTFGASAWELGWLMTSYSLMQFLFAPVWGRVSDFKGRRPVLLISIFGTAVTLTLLGFADSLAWLFIGRILAGLFGANVSTAYAYITDITTVENRAKGMGIIGAGFGLGFIFGPAIGGVLSRYGYGAPMFAAAVLAVFNFIFAYFKLEEPKLSAEARASHRNKRFDLSVWKNAFQSREAALAIPLFLMVTFAVVQMEVTFAIFVAAKFGYDAQTAGMLLGLSGIIMVGVQGGAIGGLVRRFGEVRLIVGGSLLCALGLILFAQAATGPMLAAALVLLSLGHGALHPCLSALCSKGASITERGTVLGVFQSAGSLARVIGPPVAGYLYDHSGSQAPFFSGAVVLFAVAMTAQFRSARFSPNRPQFSEPLRHR